jgi:HAD superfamily hydrolase (TIGR01549 family)
MTIRAVLFDLDDTLIDDAFSTQSSAIATARELARYCPALSPEPLADAYWRESTIIWTAFDGVQEPDCPEGTATGDWLRYKSWREALRACGQEDTAMVRQAVTEYARQREATLQFVPEAEAVLAKLRGKFRTAVITNGAADIQRAKLRKFGIAERVDYAIVSGELGTAKPDPAVFRHVAEKLGVADQECLMVGDHLVLDISGAKAAGMGAVWINRNSRALPADGPRPDFIIADLPELLTILGIAE